MVPTAHESLTSQRQCSLMQANGGEAAGSMGIGGGWQLSWKWCGSLVSLSGADALADNEYVQAATLVS
ncbi:hypothetical protein REPUB_Repub04eG0066300 [Reevesia pubescens]